MPSGDHVTIYDAIPSNSMRMQLQLPLSNLYSEGRVAKKLIAGGSGAVIHFDSSGDLTFNSDGSMVFRYDGH